MDSFSISQVARFSGIEPHTIRAWEKRYDVVKPHRSEGNTRYYSNDQLRRILNIASLKGDYKVSELCSMPDEKIFELVKKHQEKANQDEPNSYFISQLIAAGMKYDEAHFEKIFSHCLLRYGMKGAYVNVIYPLLVRIGLMWTCNSMPPAHEHFISHLIRQKLLTAIDSLPTPEAASDSWLLFLPENEFHDIGLLLANYLIRLSGKRVIFLGANVPLESLKIAVEDVAPQYMLFFLVHNDFPEETREYLDQLTDTFSGLKLFLAGNRTLIKQLKTGKKIKWLQSIEELEQQLKP